MALTEIDRNLLSRCMTNQPGAWRDFVDRYLGLFIHVVRHTAQSRSVPVTPELEDDLCAEVFVRLIENDYAILRRFRGKSSLATYLTVISRRIIVNDMARRRMAEAMGHVTGHPVERAASSAPPAESRIENREELETLLASLPPTDAEVIRRFHLQGQTYHQISQDLGIPENTLGPILSRARKRLRSRRGGRSRRRGPGGERKSPVEDSRGGASREGDREGEKSPVHS